MANKQNFSHSIIHDINEWVRRFDFSTKTNFKAYKLHGIKALRNVKIKWDFLRAAMKFWETKNHVFRFKTTEIFPTIEEFSTILGYDPSKKSVAISYDPSIGNLCLMFLVFLLPSLVVWLKHIWWLFVQLFLGWLTNAPMEWPIICQNFLAWPYALWENFCFALEGMVLWMLKP